MEVSDAVCDRSTEYVAAAASDVAGIGSSIHAAAAAAAAPTTEVVAAAGDEVSAAIASVFSSHGQGFQALTAQAAAFHEQFMQALNGAAGSYAAAEAANASPLQTLEQDLQKAVAGFSPVKDLTGRPLFGNGAAGAPGTGQAGGNGGWLFGNGGDGGSGGSSQAGGAGGSAFLLATAATEVPAPPADRAATAACYSAQPVHRATPTWEDITPPPALRLTKNRFYERVAGVLGVSISSCRCRSRSTAGNRLRRPSFR